MRSLDVPLGRTVMAVYAALNALLVVAVAHPRGGTSTAIVALAGALIGLIQIELVLSFDAVNRWVQTGSWRKDN